MLYLILLGFVNALGEAASAGVGIAEKLVMFILLIPIAYMQSISTFVAQNEGAGQRQRAKKSMWLGMAAVFTLIVCTGYYFICSRRDLLPENKCVRTNCK